MTVSVTRESLLNLIGGIELDNRAHAAKTAAKLTELRAQLAALPIPNTTTDLPRCPVCGIRKTTVAQVDEHVWVIHNNSDPALDPQRA